MSQIPAEARIVVQFSCGAASAVAGKLALAQYGDTQTSSSSMPTWPTSIRTTGASLPTARSGLAGKSRCYATKSTAPTYSTSSAGSAT